jgi:hypothetical protein
LSKLNAKPITLSTAPIPPKIMLNAILTAGVNTPTAMMIVICAARDNPRNQLIKVSNGNPPM